MTEKPEYMYYARVRRAFPGKDWGSWYKTKMYKIAGVPKNMVKRWKRASGHPVGTEVEAEVVPVLMSSWLGEETCDKDLSV